MSLNQNFPNYWERGDLCFFRGSLGQNLGNICVTTNEFSKSKQPA